MNLLLSRLDEHQRRWYAAVESQRVGRGGAVLLTQITGMDDKTIRRGRQELARSLADRPVERIRLPGGGRPPVGGKDAGLIPALEALVAPETAGDPMGAAKWMRSSLRQVSRRLGELGRQISHQTVGRLLEGLDYGLHQNVKRREAGEAHPDRAAQFRVSTGRRQACRAAGVPVNSADTKKKEPIGNFKNAGRTWGRAPEAVNVHDFPSDAACRAVPNGIYDLARNRGFVCVGSSGDTPAFARPTFGRRRAIARWWQDEGRAAYPAADRLLVLADGGGSNGCRPRAWKQQLQTTFCDRFGLTVEACHYPTGCSKWNPIEHRLFSRISLNWAGRPLRTLDTMLAYLRGTTTTTGLTVQAVRPEGQYPQGQKVSKAMMKQLNLEPHAICPRGNYRIRPRPLPFMAASPPPPSQELVA
jgi:hypothetical protein